MPDAPDPNARPPESSGNPEEADVLDQLLSAQEAARVAGIDYGSFLGVVRTGVIPARKVGPMWIVTRPALERFLADRADA